MGPIRAVDFFDRPLLVPCEHVVSVNVVRRAVPIRRLVAQDVAQAPDASVVVVPVSLDEWLAAPSFDYSHCLADIEHDAAEATQLAHHFKHVKTERDDRKLALQHESARLEPLNNRVVVVEITGEPFGAVPVSAYQF